MTTIDNPLHVRIAIVGDLRVGKGSLARFLAYGDPEAEPDRSSGCEGHVCMLMTPIPAGLSEHHNSNELCPVIVELVVAPGFRRNRQTREFLYRGCDACMVVYDKSNPATYTSLPKWHEEVSHAVFSTTNIPIALVGTRWVDDAFSAEQMRLVDRIISQLDVIGAYTETLPYSQNGVLVDMSSLNGNQHVTFDNIDVECGSRSNGDAATGIAELVHKVLQKRATTGLRATQSYNYSHAQQQLKKRSSSGSTTGNTMYRNPIAEMTLEEFCQQNNDYTM